MSASRSDGNVTRSTTSVRADSSTSSVVTKLRHRDTTLPRTRLQEELMSIMMGADPGASAFPNDDNLFEWTATLSGSEDTAYEGLTYKLKLVFPDAYPYKAPLITFETPCFHPNVDEHGNICLDILKEKWSSAFSVSTILQSLRSLLADPNNDSPLNTEAAQLWADQEKYRQVCRQKFQEGSSSESS